MPHVAHLYINFWHCTCAKQKLFIHYLTASRWLDKRTMHSIDSDEKSVWRVLSLNHYFHIVVGMVVAAAVVVPPTSAINSKGLLRNFPEDPMDPQHCGNHYRLYTVTIGTLRIHIQMALQELIPNARSGKPEILVKPTIPWQKRQSANRWHNSWHHDDGINHEYGQPFRITISLVANWRFLA